MKKIIYILVFSASILCNSTVFAQSNIVVQSGSEVQIPADLVIFQINLAISAASSQEAFKKHKEMESHLASIIEKHQLDNKNLSYQPVSINSSIQRDQTVIYRTNQRVTLSFDDTKLFEEIQLTLIDAGFDSFSGSFSSTKIEEAQKEALKLAIENAKEKAKIIATGLGGKLGKVISAEHSTAPVFRSYDMRAESAIALSSSPTMMEFSQTITISSHISIKFELIE